jgi:LysR family glycine cleavage system transcriptional activator
MQFTLGRPPALNALRTFEVAARHLSFAKAAEELRVTPSAVSLQIKGLEEYLGVKLFERLNRSILLSDAGKLLLPGVQEAFDKIGVSLCRVKNRNDFRILTVSMAPSFAARWLVLRLDRFTVRHPSISVRIEATAALTDFNRDDVDIAVRFGAGHYPGHYVRQLMRVEVFPVCGPDLILGTFGTQPLQCPGDLCHHALLHEANKGDQSLPDWKAWLGAAGVSAAVAPGLHFSNTYLAIEAAVAGRGVALGVDCLVAHDIAAGRLVRPFSPSIPAKCAYHFVCASDAMERFAVRAFHDWLFEEANRDQLAAG